MIRRSLAIVFVIALSACGGGGGSASAPGPGVPHASSLVQFTLKVPSRARQIKGWITRNGRKYVSPATLGVGLSYALGSNVTLTTAQLQTPNVTLDVTPSGCATSQNCVANADGSQTWTAQAPVPPGIYTFEVTTWDAIPSAGSFTGANMLSEGYIGSQTILAGQAAASLNVILNGVATSVSFVPLANQSHIVVQNGTVKVIGNGQNAFIANALDADGYVVAGSGAPTLAVTDSTNSVQIVAPSSTNQYLLAAQAWPSKNPLPVTVTATPPSGSGLNVISSGFNLMLVPELWVTSTVSGSGALIGYPVSNSNSYSSVGNPVEIQLSGSFGGPVIVDYGGTIWAGDYANANLNAFAQQQGSTFPQPISTETIATPGLLDVTIGAGPQYNPWVLLSGNNGTIQEFNPQSSTATPIVNYSGATGFAPNSIAIAPNGTNMPAALAGTVWVGTSSGLSVFQVSGSTLTSLQNNVLAVPQMAVAFAPDGTLWTHDTNSTGNLNAYQVTYSGGTIGLTLEGTTALTPGSSEMAVDPFGNLWVPNATANAVGAYHLSCSTPCSGSVYGNSLTVTVPNVETPVGAFVVP